MNYYVSPPIQLPAGHKKSFVFDIVINAPSSVQTHLLSYTVEIRIDNVLLDSVTRDLDQNLIDDWFVNVENTTGESQSKKIVIGVTYGWRNPQQGDEQLPLKEKLAGTLSVTSIFSDLEKPFTPFNPFQKPDSLQDPWDIEPRAGGDDDDAGDTDVDPIDTGSNDTTNGAVNESTPLVLDLDGDGIELASLNSAGAVYFDLNNDGFAEATGWTAGGDGLLALDVNGDGIINRSTELFGDQTGHANGFLALAAHDTNADGNVTAEDAVWDDLRVWIDANQNGYTESGELWGCACVGTSQ